MRRVSLNARQMIDAEMSEELPVVLMEITHPLLEAPIRLSSDNADLIEVIDTAQIRGTRSTWRGADPESEPYLHIIASVLLPSDLEDAPAAGTLVLDNLSPEMAKLLRSYTDLATISLATVMADMPNDPIEENIGLQITSSVITAAEITITYTYEERENEPFPKGRMSRSFFPGLHR
ncbi:hypothetical protein P775_11025 [Puniceibacterium antarcticum]|uniref:DUF1833 domain-containing protein n=1 Tax=Puniceibacterium antarcticum TaxID=1206336 RepID=A0A2G8RFC9_9RHOB|nr:DUF1833 family protein [Puniceibacterium antarcticum]PIL20193.1 hypothetical protein P775_11025 [Puniceibacterium antarcticum]